MILPFSDDEERVGKVVHKVAAFLTSHGAAFEILAVDEGSGDNSVALLALLARTERPELRLLAASPGAGFAAGAAVARGRTLWFYDPTRSGAPLAPVSWALDRLSAPAGAADIVVVPGRYVLARRTRAWPAALGVRGRGARFERSLRWRARRHGLRVEAPAPVAAAHPWFDRPAGAVGVALWARVKATYALAWTRR